MNDNYNIQEIRSSITFNPYKHHLGYLRKKIGMWKELPWTEAEKEIKLIGSNLIDLYFGSLTVIDIFNEVTEIGLRHNLTSSANLKEWLKPFDYKKEDLSDASRWVIRQGHDAIRFLHIHPGKYSPFTIRVKAPALKTVVALQVFNIEIEKADIQTVNQIRTEMLNLSPVKSLVAGMGLAKLMANFNSL